MFAFARDNGLPFSKFLSYVWMLCTVTKTFANHTNQVRHDIPLNAILVVFTIGALLSLINLGSGVAFNAILSIGIVSLLTSYMVSISCILWKRIRGHPLMERRWDLGRWGAPLNVIGLAYVFIAWLFAFFPLGTPVVVTLMNWASLVYGAVAILASAYFVLFARHTYVAPIVRVAKDM
jgi:amino acid transporter